MAVRQMEERGTSEPLRRAAAAYRDAYVAAHDAQGVAGSAAQQRADALRAQLQQFSILSSDDAFRCSTHAASCPPSPPRFSTLQTKHGFVSWPRAAAPVEKSAPSPFAALSRLDPRPLHRMAPYESYAVPPAATAAHRYAAELVAREEAALGLVREMLGYEGREAGRDAAEAEQRLAAGRLDGGRRRRRSWRARRRRAPPPTASATTSTRCGRCVLLAALDQLAVLARSFGGTPGTLDQPLELVTPRRTTCSHASAAVKCKVDRGTALQCFQSVPLAVFL